MARGASGSRSRSGPDKSSTSGVVSRSGSSSGTGAGSGAGSSSSMGTSGRPKSELGSPGSGGVGRDRSEAQKAMDTQIIGPFLDHGGCELRLVNVTATANMGCPIDLKTVVMRARNAEYNPKRFSACVSGHFVAIFFVQSMSHFVSLVLVVLVVFERSLQERRHDRYLREAQQQLFSLLVLRIYCL